MWNNVEISERLLAFKYVIVFNNNPFYKMELNDNPNYQNDMENAFRKGDISDVISTIKDEDYRNYIQKKFEIIIQSFQSIDKNKDSWIDFDELINFLNSNMTVILLVISKVWQEVRQRHS